MPGLRRLLRLRDLRGRSVVSLERLGSCVPRKKSVLKAMRCFLINNIYRRGELAGSGELFIEWLARSLNGGWYVNVFIFIHEF